MSFRKLHYTKPAYLDKYAPEKQPRYIIDFGQLERKADYYREQSIIGKYAISFLVSLFFLSVFSVYGYYSLFQGVNLSKIQLSHIDERTPLVQPTVSTKKVVESVSLSNEKKQYTYTVQNGDSYARLVKRAVAEYCFDHDIELSSNERNSIVFAIVSGIDRSPLHPGDTFTLSSEVINEAMLPIRP